MHQDITGNWNMAGNILWSLTNALGIVISMGVAAAAAARDRKDTF